MKAEKQRKTKVPSPSGPGGPAGRKDMSAGIVFAASIVVFSLGGYILDVQLGTLPLCMLLGLAIGGIGGFIHLVETVSPGTLFSSRRRGAAKVGEQADDDRRKYSYGPKRDGHRVEDHASDEQEQ